MPVVEGPDQPDLIRAEHAVAEHVARHVADADDGERSLIDVVPELAEVPAHALPGAAGGDPERLVVVAGRAARRERVAEPEPVLGGDRVRRVRERRRALVGRDHEVGVVAVVDAYAGGMHDRARDHRVGHVEHPADQRRVLAAHLVAKLVAPARGALEHEPALAADGHDHGVLDHLRLHQAQHLGAVVLAPIGPADAAAGDRPSAEMHALHLGVAHEDLEQRGGLGHRGHVGRAQLQAQPPAAIGPERVGAHGRQHELEEAAQDAILVEARDGIDARADRLAELVHLALRSRGLGPAEARVEQLEDQRGGLRVVDQDLALVGLGELAPHALAVPAVGAQDLHVLPRDGRPRHEPVQEVRVGVAEEDRDHRLLDRRAEVFEVELPLSEQHAEVVQVRTVVRPALEARRHLLDDGHPEPLEHRKQR